MTNEELAAWELAMSHVQEARRSVDRLHRLLVDQGSADEDWRPASSVRLAEGALMRARMSRPKPPPDSGSETARSTPPTVPAGRPVQPEIGRPTRPTHDGPAHL